MGTEDGNVISVSDFGVGAFYQEIRFSCTYHVEKVYPKDRELNKYTALFITTVLNQGASKYSYGRIRNLSNLKKEKMFLPIKDKKIDWEYLENFMKDLYKEVVVSFEKELEKISL